MPTRLFWIYAKALPILHARESIHHINELSIAFGSMDKEQSQNFIADLEQMSQRKARPASVPLGRPQSMEGMHRLLGMSSTKTKIA